jgi:hypothetical protein
MADIRKRRPAEGGAPSLKEDRPEDSTLTSLFVTPLVTLTGGPSVALLIEAEAHVRQALRIVELDPDPDARREARVLDLAAARIRARRWAA